ncbi:MAG: cation-translocating P-type ATPase [Planctomycetota bacterium]
MHMSCATILPATDRTSSTGGSNGIDAPSAFERYNELGLALLGGLLLLAGFITHLVDGPHALRLTLLACSAIATSTRTFPEAIESLRDLRLNVDVLMFVAAGGAAVLGAYEEGAFLLFLFGLGSAGQHLAVDRARRSIDALAQLAPDTALVVEENDETREVHVDEITADTILLLRPFDRIALDGVITDGASAIDESMLTGESVPVDKTIGDEVFAGTMNASGTIRMRVTRAAKDSTLARIMQLVQEAQQGKSSTQRFTDRIETFYVPAVFIIAILLLLIPPMLFDGAWATWFYRAMAFLTAASPCALAIGTPAATLCGIARGAQLGVLIKGGQYLDTLGTIDAVAFDKTGTLTRGQPEVVNVTAIDGMHEDDILATAAAIDRDITHPLADAIVDAATARDLEIPRADDVEQIPGVGARGTMNNHHIDVVKPSAVTDDHWPASLREQADIEAHEGRSLVLVCRDDVPIGLISLADQVRDEARTTIDRLHAMGVSKQLMLTGDHRATAEAVARTIDLDDVHADLKPDEKLHLIDELQSKHGDVAMVGDGTNDAPALARATVGVAMGAGSSDVALETADIAMIGSSLERLPDAIGLSRASRRIIMQNLIIALAVILIVAPLGALGIARLGLAVLLHEGSTIIVVLNSLRLLGYRAK